MKVLIVSQSEIRRRLPMHECMDVMAEALAALARGDAILPLRPIMWLPGQVGALALMPSHLANIKAMGVKVIGVFPGNHGTKFDSHQGAMLLFDTTHGQLLAILGVGVQARTHLAAMIVARPITSVRVWSRDAERAQRFAEREARRHGVAVGVAASVQAAVDGADIICTTTAAKEPVLRGEWIAPGTHINAAGASVPAARELDTAAVVRSRLYVDRRESTLNEAGDFLIPKREGAITDAHIVGEIGELLLGTVKGRGSAEEITLFKSLGLAVEDLAAAEHLYKKAIAAGAGVLVELGGERDEDDATDVRPRADRE